MAKARSTEVEVKKVVGYIRFNTTVSNPRFSVEYMKESLEAYAVDRGWELLDIYEDRASANDMSRPGYAAMMKRLKEDGDVDGMLTYSLDRLHRNTKNMVEMVRNLTEKGKFLVSVREEINTFTPFGRMVVSTVAAFAEMEREMLSERVKAGIAAATKRKERA